MRDCRYCRQPFEPAKPYYYYCTWECRVAHVGPDYERDGRGRDQRDDGGRARPMAPRIPPHIYKAAIVLVHPDRWQDTPSLAALAHEVTVWLNQHRPQG